jgi:hypothetical protein
MSVMGIVNIVAVILSPIVAVLTGQYLQKRSEKRKDKMYVFMTLMKSRAFGWDIESVNALNVIDIVFSDNKDVRDAWKNHYSALCVSEPKENELKRIQDTKYKLLEVMAKSLGYKDTINWETIQNPYYPKGLYNQHSMSQQNQELQTQLYMKMSALLDSNQGKNEKHE